MTCPMNSKNQKTEVRKNAPVGHPAAKDGSQAQKIELQIFNFQTITRTSNHSSRDFSPMSIIYTSAMIWHKQRPAV